MGHAYTKPGSGMVRHGPSISVNGVWSRSSVPISRRVDNKPPQDILWGLRPCSESDADAVGLIEVRLGRLGLDTVEVRGRVGGMNLLRLAYDEGAVFFFECLDAWLKLAL